MFDDRTFENVLNEVLAEAPEGIDTREGSIYYDAVAATVIKIAEIYTQMGTLYDQMFLKTAIGEALDLKGNERMVERKKATQAEYGFVFEGVAPPLGASFYSESGLYFTLLQYSNGTYYLESVGTGTINNDITENSIAVPVETYTELTSAKFGRLYVPAIDDETDDEYRQSIYDSIVPGENGNIQHYKNWCKEADEGVGHARIIPCADGPNTVKGVIIAADGTAASDELVAKVQAYVDPDNDGDGMGDGLGEGVANMGAHFTAVAPIKIEVPVYIEGLNISKGYTAEEARVTISNTIDNFFKELITETEDNVFIKSSALGAVIQELDCTDSYSNISLSESLDTPVYSIKFEVTDIPVLGKLIGVGDTN